MKPKLLNVIFGLGMIIFISEVFICGMAILLYFKQLNEATAIIWTAWWFVKYFNLALQLQRWIESLTSEAQNEND